MAGITITIHDNFTSEIAEKLPTAATRAEHWLAIQIMKDTDPYVPAQTRSLANRTQAQIADAPKYDPLSERRKVVGNKIIYPGPYARFLYYGHVMYDPATGKGPMKIVFSDGSEIFRFRKHSRLKPSSKELKISTAVNPKATSHWIEQSKIDNLKRWLKVGEELILRGLDKR